MKRNLTTALAIVAALSLTAAACKKKDKDKPAPKPTGTAKVTTPPPAKKLTLTEANKQCFEAFSKKDWKAARACLADNAVQTMEGMPMKTEGADAIIKSATEWSAAMDGTDHLEVVLINGSNVLNMMSFTGKNVGPLPMMGVMKATNNEVSGFGFQLVTYNDDNKSTSAKDFWDVGLAMGQLTGKAPSTHKSWGMSETHVAKNDDAEKANLAAFDAAIAAVQKGDMKGFLSVFADDAEIYMNGAPTLKGGAGKGDFLKAFVAAFPDLKLTVESKWAAGPYVFAEVGWTGTNKGAFKPLIDKATGKAVKMTNGELFLMEGGKVKKQWIVMNSASLMMQLGLVKPPAAPPAGDDKAAPAKGDDKAAPAKADDEGDDSEE